MSLYEILIEGTVQPDGTLQFDSQPSLPPGRVRMVIHTEDWWSYLQRCRQELELAGSNFRSGGEIEFEIEQVRGETDRVDGVRWEQEWQQHHPENPSC